MDRLHVLNYRLQIPPDLRVEMRGHPYFRTPRVFKYMRAKDAKSMIERGTIRLGSLGEYAAWENKQLGDWQEGLNIASVAETTLSEVSPQSVIRSFVGAGGDGVIKNSTFVRTFTFPTFCFTYENTAESFNSIRDAANDYDAVIEISDIHSVARAVAKRMVTDDNRNLAYLCLPVVYKNVIRGPHEPKPSNFARVFEKNPRFRANVEGRFILCSPDDKSVGARSSIFEYPEIRPYLSLGKLP